MLVRKSSSTKSERIMIEILKRNHITFEHRKKVLGREIDFIIGKLAVEIDGHEQSSKRNDWLVRQGFTPVHYTNKGIQTNRKEIEDDIISKIWHLHQHQ